MSIIPDVFKWRQQRFIVTPKDTEYTLRYLGSMRTLRSRGESCCDYPIKKIWKHTEGGERYVKAKMYLGTKGMRLVRAGGVSSNGDRKGDREQFFHLHRINCCRTSDQHPTVFAWIYRHELPRLQVSLRVHVAACHKDDQAHEIANTITDMYQTAFDLFKREKAINKKKLEQRSSMSIPSSPSSLSVIERSWSEESEDGDDSDEEDTISMTEALPPTPLRRIINARCSFKPPLAHRLSLQTQMLVIRESRYEGKENPKVRYSFDKVGILDSPTLKREEEKFEDFQPADLEL
ncbi:protein FAM43B-like [Lytechinus variegatus]|uniref:protein FAM43B-like n=1 Tax=Lytechinus variegatus TaxID=7654 RepID=UPI001BB2123E|nr:protein FAM43B-like [Lytechinus variegatus]